MTHLSENTQAILLLTAPLTLGRSEAAREVLTPGEYKKLARVLYETHHQPSDLLGSDGGRLIDDCQGSVDPERLKRLLGRGFLLSQALERWQARAMWVVSRADKDYPARLRARLKDNTPAVLYGCGDHALLGHSGLAVVGSRNADQTLTQYTESVGRLAAQARIMLISGGARGIDQTAMLGALSQGGTAAAVLADSLESMALQRHHREYLMNGRLVLVSPYDPSASFHVGNAMQRNKLIYALSDAALVIHADYQKGGTWAGAAEQLEKLHFVPVFVHVNTPPDQGCVGLQKLGAQIWPEPHDPDGLSQVLSTPAKIDPPQVRQTSLPFVLPETRTSDQDSTPHTPDGSDERLEPPSLG